MKNIILSSMLLLFAMIGVNAQCSINLTPNNALLPLGIEGTAFQYSTWQTNPLPANVTWQVDGGAIILATDASTEFVLIDFPNEGLYSLCAEDIDSDGNVVCSICLDYNYLDVPVNTCGDVIISAFEDPVDSSLYQISALNIDSVDLSTISWDVGGATIVSTNPNASNITVQYPTEGIYFVCLHYNSISGETCAACTSVDYSIEVDLPCSVTMEYAPVEEASYQYYFYAEFSEAIDASTINWDVGTGVELPVDDFPGILGLIQVDFGTIGVFPVCVSASTLDGDVCSECLDVVVDGNGSSSCTASFLAVQTEQYGMDYSLEINSDLSLLDPSTIQWDLGEGTLASGTLNDSSLVVTFPVNDETYTIQTVCMSASNYEGEDCSICQELLVFNYGSQPCNINLGSEVYNQDGYEYFVYAELTGDVDESTLTWDFGGGSLLGNQLDPGFNFNLVDFPTTGTYTVCATAMSYDGTDCITCIDVVVEEYVPEPCTIGLSGYPYDPGNYIYEFAINGASDIDYSVEFNWVYSQGTLLYEDAGIIQIQFPEVGMYDVCVGAMGLDGDSCTVCTTINVEDFVSGPCNAGFWYYQDEYTGSYYVNSFVEGGQAPYTYDWVVAELGLSLSDQASFIVDDPGIDLAYTICLTVTDANGNVCDYCEFIDSEALVPFSPSDDCSDFGIIDLTIECGGESNPVCGCDGVTYQNPCVAEQYFGLTEYTFGSCPGYTDPDNPPIEPEDCTAEFFYLGQANGTGGADLFFLGFGNNADDYIWNFGNGEIANGPEAYLTIDDTSVLNSFTVCLTTVSYWDTCSVTVCETIVLDANPDGWIEGFVYDNSDDLVGTGQVERVMSSDGEPMAEVSVDLVDWNGNIIESTTTDIEGRFIFTQLYFGDYHIHINVDGAEHTPYLVTLDPVNQFEEEIYFELNSSGAIVSGLEENNFASNIILSPNPTAGQVELSLDVLENTELEISILDVTGRMLFQVNRTVDQGIFNEQLILDDYTSGIYFITIQSYGNVITRKIVKE